MFRFNGRPCASSAESMIHTCSPCTRGRSELLNTCVQCNTTCPRVFQPRYVFRVYSSTVPYTGVRSKSAYGDSAFSKKLLNPTHVCISTGETCLTHFSLAEILVLAGITSAGGMVPPTSTRISARMKCGQGHSSPVHVHVQPSRAAVWRAPSGRRRWCRRRWPSPQKRCLPCPRATPWACALGQREGRDPRVYYQSRNIK